MKKHLNRILLQAKGGKGNRQFLFSPFFISQFFFAACYFFFSHSFLPPFPPSINATRLLTDGRRVGGGQRQKRVWNGCHSNRGATASTREPADANQFGVATWRYACRLASSVAGVQDSLSNSSPPYSSFPKASFYIAFVKLKFASEKSITRGSECGRGGKGRDKFGDSIAEKFTLQARLIPKHQRVVLNKTQKAEELDFWCIYAPSRLLPSFENSNSTKVATLLLINFQSGDVFLPSK